MAPSKTRWGILGTGMIAGVLADAIKQSERGELVAVGSRKPETAQAFAQAKGIPTAHGSYSELLADPQVDIVYNSLPNALHCESTVQIAEAGKHILCEKPIAVTVEECDCMFAAADANGVRLMEAFMYRCHPQTARLRELVAEGRIGDLRLVHSTFSFFIGDPDNVRLSKPLYGGGLMDVGCYCSNFSRFIAGAEPVSVFAAARFGAESGVDENFAGTLVFDGGLFAQFDVSVKSAGRASAEIVGTTGRIIVPSPWKPADQAAVTVQDSSGTHEIEIASANPYVLEVDHFSRCVTDGEQPLLSRADSVGNTRTVCALRESARTGEVVEL